MFPGRKYYNNYCNKQQYQSNFNNQIPTFSIPNESTQSESTNAQCNGSCNVENSCATDDYSIASKELFEIFGFKVYFDDLLIVCILLFLYQEGVEDEYLFISLILLLFS